LKAKGLVHDELMAVTSASMSAAIPDGPARAGMLPGAHSEA
jgi:hypothetical protein